MANSMRDLCLAPPGQLEIMQGNLAFAVGAVRAGIHAADGYPGTPSSEVIDKGFSKIQDLLTVGWSVNEAVAAAVGHGHTLAGRDCIVTMKIPGLFQAGDVFTSGSLFTQPRGALIYYIASDFTPSSTQHTIDPRYLFKSAFTPVLEPRSHQELYDSTALAIEIARRYNTQVVIMPNGALCHSEGLVRLQPAVRREPLPMPASLRAFNVLPSQAQKNYLAVMAERMPALAEMVENSPLNRWQRSSGKTGVITYGVSDLYLREVLAVLDLDVDILSLGFTNPLPMRLIGEFLGSIQGEVFVFEDGYRYVQEAAEQTGFKVTGKEPFSTITEWSPALIAEKLGRAAPLPVKRPAASPPRPPVICAGCPYRLFAEEVSLLRKKKQLDVVFGDIGCNTLLYFMNAVDTALSMGACEAERAGYVLSNPQMAGRCMSVIGDSTECHSGLEATRNSAYRNVPGVKVILDNAWTGMTGGQPSPTSPANLAGQPIPFDLPASLQAHGAQAVVVGAYQKKEIRKALRQALSDAEIGAFTTIVVNEGACIQKAPPSEQRVWVDPEACKKCNACLVCPGLELDADGVPQITYLCSGCGGQQPACVQLCPTGVLRAVSLEELHLPLAPVYAEPPLAVASIPLDVPALPERLTLAIRGVGGQGNLFFGHVLSQLALLAGYGESNIIKGETHGMAQMGGPVLSTFSCGRAASPVPLPGTADTLIAMEASEALRPGFLEMLKPGGAILLARTRILPPGLPAEQYPPEESIHLSLASFNVLEADVLGKALELGDLSGRVANVVMLGLLSTVEPFAAFPPELWLQALRKANPRPVIWAANYVAFQAGRELGQQTAVAA